jgi:hypothetical protein
MDDPVTLFLREHVLPRLDNVECQLTELREVTWPYVQAKRDLEALKYGVSTHREKMAVLRWLDIDEIRKLLRKKAYWMASTHSIETELSEILVT